MAQEVKALARIRKILEAIDAESVGEKEAQLVLNQQLELLIAPGSAPYDEIVKPGRAFWTGNSAAQAGVVAIPTVGVLLALYNAASAGGKVICIDWIAALNIASTAVASQAVLLAMNGQLNETAQPTDAALTIKKANGLGVASLKVDSVAVTQTANLPATTGIAANWCPLGPSVGKPGVAATPGYGLWADVAGRFEVPPGRYFGINVLANVVGETFQGYIGWHEKQITQG